MNGTSESVSKKRKLPAWMTTAKKDKTKPNSEENSRVHPAAHNLQLPLLTYKGSVIYSYQKDDCSLLVQEISEKMHPGVPLVVGFDMEWPVTYQAGAQSKTALIQLSTSLSSCYLFQLACMGGLPRLLKEFLMREDVIKVGIGIQSDFWKLARDYDFPAKSVIGSSIQDLSKLANEVLKSSEHWSLDNLARNLLGKKLDKAAEIRQGDWDHYPLTAAQQRYAALDAYASLLIYQELMKKKSASKKTAGNL